MTSKLPALGAQGWFSTEGEPHLIGSRCTLCGTYAFPPKSGWCPNPACRGTETVTAPLSRTGHIWSYTDAQYQPPAPYIVDGDEFEPFAIAAVALAAEGLVVLGQLTRGVTVDDVKVGDEVEVVVDTLFSDGDNDHLIWRWQPTGGSR